MGYQTLLIGFLWPRLRPHQPNDDQRPHTCASPPPIHLTFEMPRRIRQHQIHRWPLNGFGTIPPVHCEMPLRTPAAQYSRRWHRHGHRHQHSAAAPRARDGPRCIPICRCCSRGQRWMKQQPHCRQPLQGCEHHRRPAVYPAAGKDARVGHQLVPLGEVIPSGPGGANRGHGWFEVSDYTAWVRDAITSPAT